MVALSSRVDIKGTRMDTFMREQNCISTVDLLCIDLQGYELNALKSFGQRLHDVKYIITECSIQSTLSDVFRIAWVFVGIWV
jgi:FkbM family methyltransferase